MTRDTLPELISALVFSALAVLLINPLDLWMPSMAHTTLLACAVIAFGIIILFFLRERVQDERDEAHRSVAGRAAFLAGSAVLIVGIIVQNGSHQIDTWLVGALIAMVLAKVTARVWTTWYR